MNTNNLILLLIGILAANLPFMSERLFFVFKFKDGNKNFAWRLLEWIVLYFIVGGLAYLLETRMGQAQVQKWEFYAITFCLFLVFAYPGFVYRYFWRKRLN